jgi:UDPglucose--hexose-1-phosphate uridylyltransferase
LPSLRQDPATRKWSIIATERAKRPDDFVRGHKEKATPETYDESCPFCPGNEHMTPDPVLTIPDGDQGASVAWQVRVVPNKFAALMRPTGGEASTARTRKGPYLEMDGIGEHEVVIESPDHSKTIATMTEARVSRLISTYRTRFLELDGSSWNQQIVIFRNQGEGAGTSLSHPHSQIIGTPFVPEEIRTRLEVAQRHYDDCGTCIYCEMLQAETVEKSRIVDSNAGFVAFAPFASIVPYNTWIVPRRHASSFGVISEEETGLLGSMLLNVLKGMYSLLGNPDYNYVVRSAPHHSAGEPHFHWYLDILPRLTTRAGFEIGSGMNINVVVPEDAASQLREAVK